MNVLDVLLGATPLVFFGLSYWKCSFMLASRGAQPAESPDLPRATWWEIASGKRPPRRDPLGSSPHRHKLFAFAYLCLVVFGVCSFYDGDLQLVAAIGSWVGFLGGCHLAEYRWHQQLVREKEGEVR